MVPTNSKTVLVAALTALAVTLLGGCALGKRPRLAPELNTTGIASVDAVLQPVLSVGDAVFQADYDVTVAFDGSTVDVSTTQSAPTRRSLTIGDVRFLVDNGRGQTCDLATGTCVDGLESARVSDVQMNHDFFGTSLVARLRRDGMTAIAEPTTSTEVIAGQTATCVEIPLQPAPSSDAANTSTYCVLDNGVLAKLEAADLSIVMTDYAPTVDNAQFAPV